MFGEVYDADPVKLSPHVRNSDMNSVLDFTFQSQAVSYASGNSAKNLQSLFAGDDYYTTPDSSATALHVPRQPRHGPRRVLPRLVGQRARAR